MSFPVWLGDLGICWVGGSLYFVMSRDMVEGDPVHLGFDMWGSIEALIAWQGWFSLLSLWIKVSVGWVGGDIMEVLGPDALELHRCFTIRS